MATVKQQLQAGITTRLPCNGYFFQLLRASASVSLNFITAGATPQTELHEEIDAGFWFKSPVLLTLVEIKSETSQVIEYVYSLGQTGYDRSQTLSKLLQGTSHNDHSETVGTVAAEVVTANNDRTRIIFTADSTNTGLIYLGGSGVTAANSALILAAGDTFIDDTAAPSAFYAIASQEGQALRISEA